MTPPRRRVGEAFSEEPSSEDLERFGHEHAFCPECGGEVWEDAQYCSACGSHFTSATIHPPMSKRARRVIRTVILLLALAGLLITTIWWVPG